MASKLAFKKIDIDELLRFAEPDTIHGLYLSPDQHIQHFLKNETAFIFNGFTLALCTEGNCMLKINGQQYELRAGSLLLLSPNQLMEQCLRSDNFCRHTIVFSLDLLLELPSPTDTDIINMSRRIPVLHLSQDKMEHLLEYYRFLEREYKEADNPYREAISKTILNALVLEIIWLYETLTDKPANVRKQRQEQLADDFFLLLAHYYKKERSVTFYAGKMNRTPKYLSCEIKRITGRSILEWINEAILTEIKLRLRTTDHTILQISEDLNFSSPSVFVQFFKHHTKMTPLEYRKNI